MGDDPRGIRELLKLNFVVVKRLKWLYCTAGSLIRGICTPLELARRYGTEHILRHRLFFITNRCISGGTCVSFFGYREKYWSNQIWNIIMWILLSHLGCWMNKFCVLCLDFWVLYFLWDVWLPCLGLFSLFACRLSLKQTRFPNSSNHIFCADLIGTMHHNSWNVLCLCPSDWC